MAVLESGYAWLEFSDHQYLAPADRPTPAEVAPVLGAAIADARPDRGVLPDGPRQPRPRDGARRLPPGRGRTNPGASGSATRTTATSICPGCWPGGWRSCCARTPGRLPPSSRTCPTRSASAAPSGATRPRSPPLEQDHALSARMEGRVPEQFWHLAPPPPGWEGSGRPHLIAHRHRAGDPEFPSRLFPRKPGRSALSEHGKRVHRSSGGHVQRPPDAGPWQQVRKGAGPTTCCWPTSSSPGPGFTRRVRRPRLRKRWPGSSPTTVR